eukprot:2457744-Rhodomonas_salina.5
MPSSQVPHNETEFKRDRLWAARAGRRARADEVREEKRKRQNTIRSDTRTSHWNGQSSILHHSERGGASPIDSPESDAVFQASRDQLRASLSGVGFRNVAAGGTERASLSPPGKLVYGMPQFSLTLGPNCTSGCGCCSRLSLCLCCPSECDADMVLSDGDGDRRMTMTMTMTMTITMTMTMTMTMTTMMERAGGS